MPSTHISFPEATDSRLPGNAAHGEFAFPPCKGEIWNLISYLVIQIIKLNVAANLEVEATFTVGDCVRVSLYAIREGFDAAFKILRPLKNTLKRVFSVCNHFI